MEKAQVASMADPSGVILLHAFAGPGVWVAGIVRCPRDFAFPRTARQRERRIVDGTGMALC